MSQRTSPLDMGWMPGEVRSVNGWETTVTYAGEKRLSRLFVTDLSHLPKWARHKKEMDEHAPLGLAVPRKPGQVNADGDRLLVRLTPTECLIVVLRGEMPTKNEVALSNVTDAYATFALVGLSCLEVLKKLSPVDLEAPGQDVPCAAQAPIHDLRCVILRLEGKDGIPGLIILGDRGYGQFLLDIFLDAGKEFDIAPAGWNRFESWLKAFPAV